MILSLVKNTSKILNTKPARFDFLNPPMDPVQLARDLTETMLSLGGIGLSANQVGIPYQFCVIAANPVLAMFNPLLVDTSIAQVELEEGCLSYPGLILRVNRSSNIRIRFTMPNGETVTRVFQGMTSRIVQHEIMHLEGERFTDMVGPVQLQMAKKKATKMKRQASTKKKPIEGNNPWGNLNGRI